MDYLDYLKRRDADGVYEIQAATGDFYTILNVGLRLLSDLLTGLTLALMLIVVHPVLSSIVFIVFGSLAVFYLSLSRRQFLLLGVKRNFHEASIVEICQNAFRGNREIRLLNKVEYFVSSLATELERVGKINVLMSVINVMPRQVLELVFIMFFTTGILFKEMSGVSDDTFLFVGMIFVVTGARFVPLISSMVANANQIRVCRDSLDRIFSIVGAANRGLSGNLTRKEGNPGGTFERMELSEVKFAYPGSSDLVLRGVDLTLMKGTVVGIVGASGSGKTTLLSMICGFFTPDSGSIKTVFSDRGSQDKRPLVNYVPADAFLTSGTLLENITLDDRRDQKVTDDVKRVLNLVCLDECVSGLKQGLQTCLGQSGTRMSSGQRQRVALARALYHGSDILILDEATNAIDIATEQKIFYRLAHRRKNSVVLIVSHRQSTLAYCDEVFVLSDGTISLVGNKDEFFKEQLRSFQDA